MRTSPSEGRLAAGGLLEELLQHLAVGCVGRGDAQARQARAGVLDLAEDLRVEVAGVEAQAGETEAELADDRVLRPLLGGDVADDGRAGV